MASPRARFALAASAVALAIGGLIAWALMGSTAYYRTPAELLAQPAEPGTRIRVAGNVVGGSIETEGPTTRFAVTDGVSTIRVSTTDVLPDTFGAGVEVVAEGAMGDEGTFSAHTVLAKCPSKFKARRA